MFKVSAALVFIPIFAGCASQSSQPIDLHGKTVGLAVYPIGDFYAMRNMIALGATGGPKDISAAYGIEDPAQWVGQELLRAIVRQCGAEASPVSIPTNTSSNWVVAKHRTEATNEAARAAGIDLLVRVRWEGGAAPLLTAPGHRFVDSNMYASVSAVRTGQRRDLFCRQESEGDPPTYDELVANKGRRLGEILDQQRKACLEEFRAEIVKICR